MNFSKKILSLISIISTIIVTWIMPISPVYADDMIEFSGHGAAFKSEIYTIDKSIVYLSAPIEKGADKFNIKTENNNDDEFFTENIPDSNEYSSDFFDYMSEDELDYFARCVMAEAGNQSELGQRLVIDVICNRAARKQMSYFDVINEKNQFQCVKNGFINTCVNKYSSEKLIEIKQLIFDEIINGEESYDVYYFKTKKYHNFGTPIIKEGDHYFSGL